MKKLFRRFTKALKSLYQNKGIKVFINHSRLRKTWILRDPSTIAQKNPWDLLSKIALRNQSSNQIRKADILPPDLFTKAQAIKIWVIINNKTRISKNRWKFLKKSSNSGLKFIKALKKRLNNLNLAIYKRSKALNPSRS